MIICLCHGVSDRQVREEARHGANSLDAIERCCGAGGDCGHCRADVRKILREARTARREEKS